MGQEDGAVERGKEENEKGEMGKRKEKKSGKEKEGMFEEDHIKIHRRKGRVCVPGTE